MTDLPFIPPAPAGYDAHLWLMIQARIASYQTSREFMGCRFWTWIDLRDQAIELGLRTFTTLDRRFELRVITEDIEDYKYGGPHPRSRYFSHKGRALIAYGIAKLRAMHGAGQINLPDRSSL